MAETLFSDDVTVTLDPGLGFLSLHRVSRALFDALPGRARYNEVPVSAASPERITFWSKSMKISRKIELHVYCDELPVV